VKTKKVWYLCNVVRDNNIKEKVLKFIGNKNIVRRMIAANCKI